MPLPPQYQRLCGRPRNSGRQALRPLRSKAILAGGLLMVMTLAAYRPAMHCGFIWDDDDYVQNNRTLPSADGLRRIWFEIGATKQYYPLVHTTYWLEYRCWKLSPAGYHTVNILLHALSALLLWRVLATLRLPGAWVAAAVFALHPMQVESVAWITERKNVLSTTFYLASALAYLRYALAPRDAPAHRRTGVLYAASLVLFACALLSKTVTASLPAALLLVVWLKRGRIGLRDLLALVPFLALGLALGLLTVWMEKHQVGAVGAAWNLSPLERCLVAGRALWFYAGKLLWPAQLIFVYPRWRIDAEAWSQYLFPAAAATVLLALWLGRPRLGRGPLVAALYFTATLGPALGFFDVYPMRYSFVADHFQYLAGAGLIALVVAVGRSAVDRLSGYRTRCAAILPVLILTTLGVLTLRRQQAYQNLETLWRDTLRKNPDAWLAHNNLGTVLQDQGRLDQALHHYLRALQLKSDYALALNNVGNVLRLQGRLDQAIDYYRRALRCRPDLVETHNRLGTALQAQGRLEEAIDSYLQATQVNPDFALSYYNLGNALKLQGKFDQAISRYLQVLQIKPDFAEAHHGLGVVLILDGRLAAALEHFREALRLKPRWAEPMIAAARILATHPDAEVRRENEAIRLARRAAELTGHRDAWALDTLAAAYAAAGRFEQAVTTARRALGLALTTRAEHLARGLRERLALYRQARVYREPRP